MSNAFFNGHLSEEVYIQQPQGVANSTYPKHVCHFRHSLYGLKQALRTWYCHLTYALHSLGFRGSHTDSSLFYYKYGTKLAFCMIYVDDLLFTSNDDHFVDSVVQSLQK